MLGKAHTATSSFSKGEIEDLLGEVSKSIRRGDWANALRLTDRAWRVAPDVLSLCQIYMTLLVRNGQPGQATRVFRTINVQDYTPDIAAVQIEALCMLGKHHEACAILENSLCRFAVERGSALALSARKLVDDLGVECGGWIGIDPDLTLVGDVRASGRTNVANLELVVGSARYPVALSCSDGWVDGNALAQVAAINGGRLRAAGQGVFPIGADLKFPPEFGLEADIEMVDEGIRGTIRLSWLPPGHVPAVSRSTAQGLVPLELVSRPDKAGVYTFIAKSGPIDRIAQRQIELVVHLPDGRTIPFPGSPFRVAAVEAFRPSPVRAVPSTRLDTSAGVAVIVPVYKGRDDVQACLDSIFATTEADVPIVIVNDASPDLALVEALERFASEPRVTLITNRDNLGFPASINVGLAQFPQHDAVIINSDTLLFGDWLDRLRRHAEADPRIATITPLTNAGSIASYPAGIEGPCDPDQAEYLDSHARIVNAGQAIDVPTGVGFCMFMRRACMDQIGSFDAELFGAGYGEENDFCMRASAYGWRNVVAADIFVAHRNGISFGAAKKALMSRNSVLLAQRHPAYSQRVAEFVAADPLAGVRRSLDIARLKSIGRPICLLVTHALSGGVSKHVAARADELARQGYAPLVLQPDPGFDRIAIRGLNAEYADLNFRAEGDEQLVGALLAELAVEHVELHHFLGFDAKVIDVCLAAGWPTDIFLHDHSWYCPRINLIDGANRYCGETDRRDCGQCLRKWGSLLDDGLDDVALRRRSGRWLAKARNVIAPSHDTARRYTQIFPGVSLTVRSWEEKPVRWQRVRSERSKAFRIAVIGAIGVHKGYDRLLQCVAQAMVDDLALEFILIGFSQDDIEEGGGSHPLMDAGRIFVTGKYDDDELPYLLEREAPAAILFLSICPETWSYTLTHALAAGLPIVAYDIGAIAERLRESRADYLLVDLDTTAEQLNGLLYVLAEQGYDQARKLCESSLISAIKSADCIVRKTVGTGIMSQENVDLSTAAESLKLARGSYIFSVVGEAALAQSSGMPLPALQISPAPGQDVTALDFLPRSACDDRWLRSAGDNLVVRVNAETADLVVISLTQAGLSPLQIDVCKVENEDPAQSLGGVLPPSQVRSRESTAPDSARALMGEERMGALRAQIVVHVQNTGDMIFLDQDWAGKPNSKLTIEAFSITPMVNIAPCGVEYKGMTATGLETQWLDQGRPCGTRGLATPLLGFAVRPKAGPSTERFICEYSARFISGAMVGPVRDGMMCQSHLPSDYLESMWIRILDREAPHSSAADQAA